MIVPTNRKLRTEKKELISLSKGQTVSQINIETFGTFTKKILSAEINYIELSEAASSVFIEQSALEIDLRYFNNYKGSIPTGTLERVKNVISIYKEEGISPDDLRKEALKLQGSEKLKALDIADIYEKYNRKCAELNALEIGDVYSRLNILQVSVLEDRFKNQFEEVELIVLNGFDEFTQLELNLINKLSEFNGCELFINFDYFDYNPLIFSHLEECYHKLIEKGFRKIKDISQTAENSFTQIVKSKLFLRKDSKKANSFKKSIVKISAVTRETEVKLIAKEIKSILLKTKIKPNNICVTFNLINNYSELIRDIFPSYGIPINLTDRIALDKTYPVIAIINFLEILGNDYYYKSILRALSNAYIEIEDVDIDNILYAATTLKIVIGKNNWEYNLNNAIRSLELEEGNYEREIKIGKYQKALSDLEKINKLLAPFKSKTTPSEFMKELNFLISKLKISEKLLSSDGYDTEREVKALSTFLDTMEEIFELLEQEKGIGKKYDVSFYLNQIRTASSWARFNVKEKSDYGVLVTNINEIRGLQFDYLFIGGMIDGDFPTKYQPEIFFSGSFTRKEIHHLTQERYHLYQALCSWKKGLYFSFPKTENEKNLVESTFLKEIEKTFEIEDKNEEDYNNLVYSKEEFYQLIGREIDNPNNEEIKNESLKAEINLKKIKEAVNIENIRTGDPFLVNEFNGFLLADEENVALETKERLKDTSDKPYSISQLETYASCPFKYFLERILKVKVTEEPVEEMEAVEIGSLIHTILFEFFIEIRKKKIVLAGCSARVFKVAEDLLFNIAGIRVREVTNNSPFAFYEEEKIFGFNGNKKDSILYKFLEHERSDESNKKPRFFEVSFGLKNESRDESLFSDEPLEYENIKLRGKIDRIDINEEERIFEVIDYKSGRSRVNKGEIEKNRALQLPLYVWAAKTLLDKKFEQDFFSEALTIYSLKYNSNDFGKKPISLSRKKNIDTAEIINELVENSLEFIKESVKNISEGKFSLTSFMNDREKVCMYCDFNTICRVDEIA